MPTCSGVCIAGTRIFNNFLFNGLSVCCIDNFDYGYRLQSQQAI